MGNANVFETKKASIKPAFFALQVGLEPTTL
ncbi:MAG: hypothetical protein PWQ81_1003 [Bacteroidota bacterium]|mgnify:CR=1 FL=1|nr:hypothetical protein [Dysgonamonadaceae bacterium]MDI3505781.1 hypothetical protein [Bacteroidota bacterium]MDN5306303.1 hypothetical protein [Bacteroidota bacterium]